MRALISDIHANTEALNAVLADAKKQGVDDIYFLGDLVGYGPEPEACEDGIDNDCDGAADCGDPDCDGDPACA